MNTLSIIVSLIGIVISFVLLFSSVEAQKKANSIYKWHYFWVSIAAFIFLIGIIADFIVNFTTLKITDQIHHTSFIIGLMVLIIATMDLPVEHPF